MRPKVFTVVASAGGVSTSPVYPIDITNNPCNIAVGVTVTGSALYDVQHTFSNPWSANLNTLANGIWLNNDLLSSASTNDDTNYAFPPQAIRLSLRSAVSATATVTIIQAGPN